MCWPAQAPRMGCIGDLTLGGLLPLSGPGEMPVPGSPPALCVLCGIVSILAHSTASILRSRSRARSSVAGTWGVLGPPRSTSGGSLQQSSRDSSAWHCACHGWPIGEASVLTGVPTHTSGGAHMELHELFTTGTPTSPAGYVCVLEERVVSL